MVELLPFETIETILTSLSARDILAFASSCRRFKNIVDNSQQVQLILELATYGYRLTPNWRYHIPKNGSIQDLTQSIHRINERWSAFDYTSLTRIDCHRESGYRVINGILGVIPAEGKLRFYNLVGSTGASASSTTHEEEKEVVDGIRNKIRTVEPWIEHDIPGDCTRFYWDVRQDLLVYNSSEEESGLTMHLRTLSNNLPHPLANVQSFKIEQGGSYPISMTIVDERLIMQFRNPSGQFIVVRNWKTWEELIEPIHGAIEGQFILIADDLIMILRKDLEQKLPVWLEVHDISGRLEDSTQSQGEVQAGTESQNQNQGRSPVRTQKPTLRLKILFPFESPPLNARLNVSMSGDLERACRDLGDLASFPTSTNDKEIYTRNLSEIDLGLEDFYEGDSSAERISIVWVGTATQQYYVAVSHHHILRLTSLNPITPTTPVQNFTSNPVSSPSQVQVTTHISHGTDFDEIGMGAENSIGVASNLDTDTTQQDMGELSKTGIIEGDKSVGKEAEKENNDAMVESTINSNHYATIQWADWGPKATRWFQGASYSHYRSSYGSWLYFCHNMNRFIEANNLHAPSPAQDSNASPSSRLEIPNGAVVFCDFNPRSLKRNQLLNPRQFVPGQPHDTIQLFNNPSGRSSPSNLIARNIITEQWVLKSQIFTEEIRCSLPFQVFIRKNVENWLQCPTMGGSPYGVFTDLNKFEIFHFSDTNPDEIYSRLRSS